jgi:hypothetical protein
MTTWRNWAKVLETVDTDGSSLGVYQKFTPNNGNRILQAIRSSFIFQNSPTFTNLKFRLYGLNFNGQPGKLISESVDGGISPAKLGALAVDMVETWWEFPNVQLRDGVWYALAPYDPTYAKTDTKHIAWRKDYPDPIYTTNNAATHFSPAVQSFSVSFITAKL